MYAAAKTTTAVMALMSAVTAECSEPLNYGHFEDDACTTPLTKFDGKYSEPAIVTAEQLEDFNKGCTKKPTRGDFPLHFDLPSQQFDDKGDLQRPKGYARKGPQSLEVVCDDKSLTFSEFYQHASCRGAKIASTFKFKECTAMYDDAGEVNYYVQFSTDELKPKTKVETKPTEPGSDIIKTADSDKDKDKEEGDEDKDKTKGEGDEDKDKPKGEGDEDKDKTKGEGDEDKDKPKGEGDEDKDKTKGEGDEDKDKTKGDGKDDTGKDTDKDKTPDDSGKGGEGDKTPKTAVVATKAAAIAALALMAGQFF